MFKPIIKNTAVAFIAAFALALMIYTLYPAMFTHTSIDGQGYFYDLTTGTLFKSDNTQFPPVDAPDEQGRLTKAHMGVRAHVFSCSSCEDANSLITAYIETYPKPAWEFLNSVSLGPNPTNETRDAVLRENKLDRAVSSPSMNPNWIDAGSPTGIALVKKAIPACPDGSSAKECLP